MGFFGRLMGIEDDKNAIPAGAQGVPAQPAANSDQQAIERYHYMLRTAPPETLERAHAEAFEKLSTEQRRQVLSELAGSAPAEERASIAATPVDDAQALARVATRAEVRQPGILERSLGGSGIGFGGSLLSSFAMGFVGSMVAQSFFSSVAGFGADGAHSGDSDSNSEELASADEDGLNDEGFDDGGMDDFDG